MKCTFLKQSIFACIILVCCTKVNAQLNGAYTINAGQPTAGTNYQSFNDFATALNTLGVNGPVVAHVTPGSGPYTERVTFNNITGASATNTIRINGNGNQLQYSLTTITQPAPEVNRILLLNGTKYMHIDSLNVRSLNNSGSHGGIVLLGNAAYDSITRCLVDMTSIINSIQNTTGIGLTGTIGAAGLGGYVSAVSTAPSYCYIGSNRILGDTTAIAGNAPNNWGVLIAHSSANNIINNNRIENWVSGVMLACNDWDTLKGNIITNNTIKRSRVTPNGVNLGFTGIANSQFVGLSPTVPLPNPLPGTIITGNRIEANPNSTRAFIGISIYSGGSSLNPMLIANNAIYYTNVTNVNTTPDFTSFTGLSLLGYSRHIKIYHNTINIDQGLYQTSPMIAMSSATPLQSAIDIKNNLITITKGNLGAKIGFKYWNASPAIASTASAQHNNFYVNSTQTGVQYYGQAYQGSTLVNYTTQTSFQTAYPTLEVGSTTLDPQYANAAAGDLTPTNCALFGIGENLLASVPTDINGNPRTAYPTPGAFEHAPASITIYADGGVDTVKPICAGTPITFTATYTGTGTPHYQWKKNGVPVGTDSIAYFDSVSVNGDIVTCTLSCIAGAGILAVSNTISVVVIPVPAPVLSITGPDAVCAGATITLADATTGGVWSSTDTAVATIGAGTGLVTGNTAGITYITYTKTNNFGCSSKAVKPVQVHAAPVPVITMSGNTLYTGIYSTYQWYANNAPLPGATNQFYNFTQNGSYTVRVTDTNGCSGTSAVKQTGSSSIADNNIADAITVYPNPANNFLYINSPVKATAILYSMDGKKLTASMHTAAATTLKIDLSSFPAGLYYLKINGYDGALLKVQKLVKSNP